MELLLELHQAVCTCLFHWPSDELASGPSPGVVMAWDRGVEEQERLMVFSYLGVGVQMTIMPV
jgi:hypothetical protein